ncbi:MAG: glycosyltransferase [Anaerolineales bacterium]|nr:glycosyltransferase [Anaerolineales bacterium]
MRVLIVTNMYPTQARPDYGTFVQEQVESLRQAGIDIDVFAFDARGKIINYLKAVRDLHAIIIKGKPFDLLHAHYGLSGFVARMQIRYPVVVTFHGSDLSAEMNSQGRLTLHGIMEATIGRLSAYSATRCIVVADLLKPKIWPRSAVTIPMGVDLSLFRPFPKNQARERLGLPADKKLVAFVAHPDRSIKRYDIAQAAVRLLQADGLNVSLLSVYNQPHNRIPLYMNACDILALTSMREASPCVIKEAMACNLPIVSVKVGDVAERIEGVEGCYLSDPDPTDIAAKLRLGLENGQRTNGREKIQDLSLQNIAQSVIEVYRDTLSGYSAPWRIEKTNLS